MQSALKLELEVVVSYTECDVAAARGGTSQTHLPSRCSAQLAASVEAISRNIAGRLERDLAAETSFAGLNVEVRVLNCEPAEPALDRGREHAPSAGDEYEPGAYLGTWASGPFAVVIANSRAAAAKALEARNGSLPDRVGLLESYMEMPDQQW